MTSEYMSVDVVPDFCRQAKERGLELVAKSTVTLSYYLRPMCSLKAF